MALDKSEDAPYDEDLLDDPSQSSGQALRESPTNTRDRFLKKKIPFW